MRNRRARCFLCRSFHPTHVGLHDRTEPTLPGRQRVALLLCAPTAERMDTPLPFAISFQDGLRACRRICSCDHLACEFAPSRTALAFEPSRDVPCLSWAG